MMASKVLKSVKQSINQKLDCIVVNCEPQECDFVINDRHELLASLLDKMDAIIKKKKK